MNKISSWVLDKKLDSRISHWYGGLDIKPKQAGMKFCHVAGLLWRIQESCSPLL